VALNVVLAKTLRKYVQFSTEIVIFLNKNKNKKILLLHLFFFCFCFFSFLSAFESLPPFLIFLFE